MLVLQVADFGLSRILECTTTHVSTDIHGKTERPCWILMLFCEVKVALMLEFLYCQIQYMFNVAGTICYVAPEFLKTGRLTKRADIYSFAMLMIELFSTKPPYYGLTAHQVGATIITLVSSMVSLLLRRGTH